MIKTDIKSLIYEMISSVSHEVVKRTPGGEMEDRNINIDVSLCICNYKSSYIN